MKKLLFRACIVVFLASASYPQNASEDKPYVEWIKEDIVKVISDSPWAKVVGASDAAGSTSYVTIRLRFALPVRKTLVRLKQLESGYEKMNPENRKEFDRGMADTLDCPACADNYVVSVSPPISNRQVRSGMIALRYVKLESLASRVFFVDEKREKREIVHFAGPRSGDGEATIFFPRLNDKGEPLLDGNSRHLSLFVEIEGSQYSGTAIPLSTRFDVSPLLRGGNVLF